jgi:hypothetical protein
MKTHPNEMPKATAILADGLLNVGNVAPLKYSPDKNGVQPQPTPRCNTAYRPSTFLMCHFL